MNNAWEKVRAFQKAMEQPFRDTPKPLLKKRRILRKKWMIEELREFLGSDTIVDQTDAMIDLIYLAIGTLVEMGVHPQEAFDIVHGANMAKLGPDGRPIVRSDGKIGKPEGWLPPEPQLERLLGPQDETVPFEPHSYRGLPIRATELEQICDEAYCCQAAQD